MKMKKEYFLQIEEDVDDDAELFDLLNHRMLIEDNKERQQEKIHVFVDSELSKSANHFHQRTIQDLQGVNIQVL